MKKYILISSLILAMPSNSFAIDNKGVPRSDPDFRDRSVSRSVECLPTIPEDESVRVFETSVGSLVITREALYSKITLSLPGRRVGSLDTFHWVSSGAQKPLSIRATMTDEEIKKAIKDADLAP